MTSTLQLILETILRKKSMVFVYTAKGVLCVEYANVLELCYIELLSGDGSPYSILSDVSLAMKRSKTASKLEFALIIDFLHFVFNKHKLKFKKEILNKTIWVKCLPDCGCPFSLISISQKRLE